MDARKIVVVVEDVEVARTALQWALNNILRYGDLITLLHVYPSTPSRSKKKHRLLRLEGFQLALSFREICNSFLNTKTEIVVTEGDRDGRRIAAMVREIGASALVLGLHDRSFLYRLVIAQNSVAFNLEGVWEGFWRALNCKVLAIKQPTPLTARTISLQDSSINMDFSQIEIATLSVPEVPPTKIKFQICPDPSAIIWRSRQSRRTRAS